LNNVPNFVLTSCLFSNNFQEYWKYFKNFKNVEFWVSFWNFESSSDIPQIIFLTNINSSTEITMRSRGIHTRRNKKPQHHNHSHHRFISNPNHPIPILRSIQNPCLHKQWNLGNVQIDTRKVKRSPQYFRPPWTEIDYRCKQRKLPSWNNPHTERKVRTSH
jgi:hypothetical protein